MDWLDLIDWPRVLLGALVAVVGQVLVSLLFRLGGVPIQSVVLLVLTLAMVAVGGAVAAQRVFEQGAKIVCGVTAALLAAAVALVASVYADPENGGNLLGLVFLFVSYAAMGLIGALLPRAVHQLRERVG